jgi:hypothetical protein
MPTYVYECPLGHQTEYVCRIADRPESIACKHFIDEQATMCQEQMRQVIITAPAIQGDEPPAWMREFADSRPEARFRGQKKIENRTDYKHYLKEKGLRPTDGPNLSEV